MSRDYVFTLFSIQFLSLESYADTFLSLLAVHESISCFESVEVASHPRKRSCCCLDLYPCSLFFEIDFQLSSFFERKRLLRCSFPLFTSFPPPSPASTAYESVLSFGVYSFLSLLASIALQFKIPFMPSTDSGSEEEVEKSKVLNKTDRRKMRGERQNPYSWHNLRFLSLFCLSSSV